jgi:hypothetical protein
LYALISVIANVAIDFHVYYTGSLYDVPLLAAMVWFIGAGFVTRMNLHTGQSTTTTEKEHAIWAARLAMLAVFSTPLMVAWAEFAPNTPGARTHLPAAADDRHHAGDGRPGSLEAAPSGWRIDPSASVVPPVSRQSETPASSAWTGGRKVQGYL